MNSPRVLRFGPLAGLLVLLLAGCGGPAASAGAHSSSASAGFTATPAVEGSGPESSNPAVEGSGPESPQSVANGGGGGVAISLAGLPIGGTNAEAQNASGSAECVSVTWLAQMPSGVTLTVTGVVPAAPFAVTDLTSAGCAAANDAHPPCLHSQFTSTDNGTTCLVGIQWAGTGQPQDSNGSIEFVGNLSCPKADSATCHRIGTDILNKSGQPHSINFDFCAPDQCAPSPGPGTSPASPPGPASMSPASPASPASMNPDSPPASSP